MRRVNLLYEVRPFHLPTGEVREFNFSRYGYPGYDPVITKDLVFTDAYPESQGIIGGSKRANFGKISIKYPLDMRGRRAWEAFNEEYAFGMREITVKQVGSNGKVTVTFQGVMTYAHADGTGADIHISDFGYLLEAPFNKEVYTAGDLANFPNAQNLIDSPKPELLGYGILIEPAKLSETIRQVSIGPIDGVDDVFDNGVELTHGGNFTGPVFDDTTPQPGHYIVDTDRGWIKIGSGAYGQITVCARGRRFDDGAGGTWFPDTHGGVLKAKLTEALTADRLDGAALDALAAADPGKMGAYVTSEMKASQFVDLVAKSCGATTGHRLDGRFFAELFPGLDGDVDTVIPPEMVLKKGKPRKFKARKGFDIGYGNAGDIASIQAPLFTLSQTQTVSTNFIGISDDTAKGNARPRLPVGDVFLDAVIKEIPDALYRNAADASASGLRRLAHYGRATVAYPFGLRLPPGTLRRGNLVEVDGKKYRVLGVENNYGPPKDGVKEIVKATLWR